MSVSKIFFVFTGFILFSCDKTKTKLPEAPPIVNTELSDGFTSNPYELSGYFYAGFNGFLNNNNVSGTLRAYSVFRDPAENLMLNYNHYIETEIFNGTEARGNISVGEVSVNDNHLSESNNGANSNAYRLFNTSTINNFDYSATWKTQGNGTFKPIDLSIPKGFPRFVYPTITYTLSRSNDFAINLSNLASNYDSIVVRIGNSSSPAFSAQKNLGLNASVVTFKKEELSFLSNSSSTGISFWAFNYSNKTINSKVYVFELANKYTSGVMVVP